MSNNKRWNTQFINENKSLFEKALNAMPKNFSSFEFGKKLHSLGVPKKVTANGSPIGDYLKNAAIRISNKMWKKKPLTSQLTIEDAINKNSIDMTIQNAINLLKASGYRVFKETKHIEEV